MKKVLIIVCSMALATSIFAQKLPPDLNPGAEHGEGHAHPSDRAARAGGTSNLTFHAGGTVIRAAHVVEIFWGPSFAVAGSADASYASQLQNFRNQFGSTPEYNTVTQYSGEDPVSGFGNIGLTTLANQADMFDTTTPPTNVTDARMICGTCKRTT